MNGPYPPPANHRRKAHSRRGVPTSSFDAFNAFLAVPERPADGIRLAVKDLFDTAGLVTTYGSAIFRDHVPERTAKAVLRLEQAGYAVVGKTNLHEFAYGITSENEHFGDVVNPLDASFDTAGPMARDVLGCRRIMDLFEMEPTSLDSLEDVSIAVAWAEDAEPLVRERVEAAASHVPRRRSIDFPEPERFSPAFQREVADVHRDLFAEHRELYGTNVRTKIERCLAVTDEEVEASRAT